MRRDIEAMKKAVPLYEVVAHYVEGLRQEGDEYVACCPFHEERTPSFKVYTADNGREWFKCFGCAEHGDAITFLMILNKCTVKKAIDLLEEVYKRKILQEQILRLGRPEYVRQTNQQRPDDGN